jgi:uncharacterized membrane protein HdeD (DUF308 family)
MAKIEKRTAARQKTSTVSLPFTKINYQILAAALLCIVFGYIALAQEPWDGTLALVVAPILLVAGYCLLIPMGIIYRKRSKENTLTEQQPGVQP